MSPGQVLKNLLARTCHMSSIVLIAAATNMAPTPANSADFISAQGVGQNGEGADVVLTNLDTNPRPDVIMMAYDSPPGPNEFRYRIGRNLDVDAKTSDWDVDFISVPGVGHNAEGAGAAITNLDSDGRPELILMAYDSPSGENSFRYRVAQNLNPDGKPSSLFPSDPDKFIEIEGVGHNAQGADIVVTDLDNNNRPDLILIAYDAPPGPNEFRYRVAWNLNANGTPATIDAEFETVPGVGHEARGMGAAILNLDNDERPELLLMAYDAGATTEFRWRIGWNLEENGRTANWDDDSKIQTEAGIGINANGAGVAIGSFRRQRLMFMIYDDPPGDNSFRYVVPDINRPHQAIHLEMDKVMTVVWPPMEETRFGDTFTIQSIFEPLGLDITVQRNQGLILSLQTVELEPKPLCYNDSQLDAFLAANMNSPPTNPDAWHLYAAILPCGPTPTGGGVLLGQIFDSDQRRGIAAFINQFTNSESIMRTVAHELGHALCLFHSDADAWRPNGGGAGIPGGVTGLGRSLLNQDAVVANDWGFFWSASEMHPIYDVSRRKWVPRDGLSFTSAQCR